MRRSPPGEDERRDTELGLDQPREDREHARSDDPPACDREQRRDHGQRPHPVDLAPHRPDEHDCRVEQVCAGREEARPPAAGHRPANEEQQRTEAEVERNRQRPDREGELPAVERSTERPEQVQHREVVGVAAAGVVGAEPAPGHVLGPGRECRHVTLVAGTEQPEDPDDRGYSEEHHERRSAALVAGIVGLCREWHGRSGTARAAHAGGVGSGACSSGSGASRRYGTLTTTVWGRPSRAARRRFADWL